MAKLKKKSKTHTRSKKHHVKSKKYRTKYCKCKKPCRCTKKCKCRKTHKKKHHTRGKKRHTGHKKHHTRGKKHNTRRKKHTLKHQKGGNKSMLNPSNYPNPFPKGGPFVPGRLSNGLGKGLYYKNNTNPYLPNPKHVQSGGGLMDLAENLPGGSDVLDTWWKGSTNVKNLYQSWIGGKPYVSPDPLVQPAMQPKKLNIVPPNIPKISKQSQLTAAAFK